MWWLCWRCGGHVGDVAAKWENPTGSKLTLPHRESEMWPGLLCYTVHILYSIRIKMILGVLYNTLPAWSEIQKKEKERK